MSVHSRDALENGENSGNIAQSCNKRQSKLCDSFNARDQVKKEMKGCACIVSTLMQTRRLKATVIIIPNIMQRLKSQFHL